MDELLRIIDVRQHQLFYHQTAGRLFNPVSSLGTVLQGAFRPNYKYTREDSDWGRCPSCLTEFTVKMTTFRLYVYVYKVLGPGSSPLEACWRTQTEWHAEEDTQRLPRWGRIGAIAEADIRDRPDYFDFTRSRSARRRRADDSISDTINAASLACTAASATCAAL
jgi:hypothetical protein